MQIEILTDKHKGKRYWLATSGGFLIGCIFKSKRGYHCVPESGACGCFVATLQDAESFFSSLANN